MVAKSRHGVGRAEGDGAQHEAPVLERHTTRFRAGRQPGPLTAPVLGRGGTCRRPQSKEQLFPSREVCWVRQQTGDFCADPFLRFRQCGSCRQARALDAATLRLARQGGEDGGRLCEQRMREESAQVVRSSALGRRPTRGGESARTRWSCGGARPPNFQTRRLHGRAHWTRRRRYGRGGVHTEHAL